MARLGVLIPMMLLALAGAATADEDLKVRNKKHNFEIKGPRSSMDWVQIKEMHRDAKARFQLDLPDAEIFARADVTVWVIPASTKNPPEMWRKSMESEFKAVEKRADRREELAGETWQVFDARGGHQVGKMHLEWRHLRKGDFVYVLAVRRYNEAIEDEPTDEEINEILASFRFLRTVETPSEESVPEIDPELLKRKHMEWVHWRLKAVKPEGLVTVKTADLDQAERENGVIARFDGHLPKQQTMIMIRIYAHRKGVGRWKTLNETMRLRLTQWQERVPKEQRKEPEYEFNKWKPPLAKEMLRMRLLALGKSRQTTRWYLAECSNGVQYEIEIYFTGTLGGELWKSRIDDFLKHFRPQRKTK